MALAVAERTDLVTKLMEAAMSIARKDKVPVAIDLSRKEESIIAVSFYKPNQDTEEADPTYRGSFKTEDTNITSISNRKEDKWYLNRLTQYISKIKN